MPLGMMSNAIKFIFPLYVKMALLNSPICCGPDADALVYACELGGRCLCVVHRDSAGRDGAVVELEVVRRGAKGRGGAEATVAAAAIVSK